MLQILGTPVYTCNRFRLLSQSSFEDVKLPVLVGNRRCNRGLKLLLYFRTDILIREATFHRKIILTKFIQMHSALVTENLKKYSMLIILSHDHFKCGLPQLQIVYALECNDKVREKPWFSLSKSWFLSNALPVNQEEKIDHFLKNGKFVC